jgi:hypothetical protein
MRYYFHLENDSSLSIDHIGKEFPDLPSVTSYASELANSLARSDMPEGWAIRVVDARNTEVFWLPVVDGILSD